MNIKEFSKLTGISSYTLRYYEKIGIFKQVNRNSSGHRDFNQRDLLWAEFITRLKETGMPLEQIKEYAELREQGDSTASSRMDLLINHAMALENKIAEEQRHLEKIKDKIAYYEKLVAGQVFLDLE